MPKYEIPEILEQFEEVCKKDSKLVGIEPLGFYIKFEIDKTDYYSTTPPDVIPFAWTGGDGDHFGFLTDFGEVSDLSDAYIVSVTPMNSPQITICAKNINDFISLMCEVKKPIYLTSFHSTPGHLEVSEKEWYESLSQEDDEDVENKKKLEKWTKSLLTKLKLNQINNPYDYLKKIISQRESTISIKTIDEIGILRTNKSGKSEKTLINLKENKKIKSKDLEKVLASASHDQKLAFCRDAQQVFCLMKGEYGNKDMKNLVSKVFKAMDHNYESIRIKEL